jgi:serine/threonine protein phosphatase 1
VKELNGKHHKGLYKKSNLPMARFAISDIHGCLRSFRALLFNKIKLVKGDQLFLLGDYINKGPDSKGVLDLISQLKKDGYQVYCIRGNHDQMLLDVWLGNTSGSWLKEAQKINTLKSFRVNTPHDIPAEYISQIASMSLYIELDRYFLVHAGFYLGIHAPFLDEVAMMNIKKFDYNTQEMKGKQIIHGHIPTQLPEIQALLRKDGPVKKIDGGCVYYTSKEYGNLVGIDIDSNVLFVQPNEDFPYEVALKG